MLSKIFFAISIFTILIASLQKAFNTSKIQAICGTKDWDSLAGVVPSYTQNADVKISASSGSNAQYAIDGNEQTFWQSEAPLPYMYSKRKDINILLNNNLSLIENLTDSYIAKATDGSTDSGDKIEKSANSDYKTSNTATIRFKQPQKIALIGLKCGLDKGGSSSDLALYLADKDGKRTLLGYYDHKAHNYEWQNFMIDSTISAQQQIILEGNRPFMLFEIAAAASMPTEYLTIDLGEERAVGQVWVRGESQSNKVQVALSNDNRTWEKAGLPTTFTGGKLTGIVLSPMPTVRYIRLHCQMSNTDWAKASVREILVYDQYGPYGPPPTARAGQYTLRQSLGVNGIWGWGYGRYSDEAKSPKEGAALFGQWLSQARNYHELGWDCADPDKTPDYEAMSNGQGTVPQPWLNWDREYRAWQQAGLQTLVSIKFSNATQPALQWDNPYLSAYNYGYAFANHFGPAHGNKTVNAIDIGNEPWDYTPQFYTSVLQGMSDGMRKADPTLIILPCALQAAFPNFEQGDFKNFAGTRLNPQIVKNINAYNCHHYSYAASPENGQLRAVYPEHPLSTFRALHNDLRFVAANMPHLPVYVTEWGWDSNGGGNNDCLFAECVSENAQAIYAVRAAMYMMRLGVAKFYWYFYANSDEHASLYSRSGLLGSKAKGFLPKMSYKALKALQYHLGDKRFLEILSETNEGYAYLFGTDPKHPTHIAVWLPDAWDDAGEKSQKTLVLPFDKPIKKAVYISGYSDIGEPAPMPTTTSNGKQIRVKAGAVPVLLEIDLAKLSN